MKIDSIITEKKSKQAKASAKKPKLVKPNPGHESPHPMQGKLVGEANPNFSKGSQLDKMELPDKLLATDLHDLMNQIGPEKFIGFLFSAMTNPKFKNLSLEKFAEQIKNIYTQTRTPGAFKTQTNQSNINYGAKGLGLNNKGELDFKEATLDEGPYSASKSTLITAVINELEKNAQDEEGIKLLQRLASIIDKKVTKRKNGKLALESKIPFDQCPKCGGGIVHESQLNEKQDACYHKVKSRYKVWPSAYASGALVKCRKVGAKNWGNSSKKKKKKS